MDMNALMHRQRGAAPSSLDSFRAPASGVSPFQTPNILGLRAQLPSLPIRLAALHPSLVSDQQPRAPSPSAVAASASLISSSTSSGPSSSSSQQATSLAPLRFIIPSSHCSPATYASASNVNVTSESTNVAIRPAGMPMPQDHSAAGMPALGVPRSFSDSSLLGQDLHAQRLHAMHHQHNRPPPIEISPAHGHHDADSAHSAEDGKTRKSPAKRNRIVKNPNRSTKSKARPGLRKGKWTEEEERYATQLTNYFKEGLLPIERGTMLRLYLSQKLNCEPMRITKKFTGGECIGKQVFRPCSPTPESRIRLMQAQLELVALEAAFIKKLKENKEEVPGLTDDVDCALAPGAIAVSARPKKRRPYQKDVKSENEDGREASGFTSDSSTSSDSTQRTAEGKKNGENVDDANAVGLLLGFFYKASKNGDEDETGADSKPVKQEAPSSSASTTEPEPECDDELQSKKASDELANSPTKRMRTLSISQCHTDAISPKRSRVGSFNP